MSDPEDERMIEDMVDSADDVSSHRDQTDTDTPASERDNPAEEDAISTPEATDERPVETTAERFLELETELAGAEPTLPDGTVRSGYIADAALVPVGEVPEGYPVSLGADRALAITIELETGREVPAYLDWPADEGPTADSMLGRLLQTVDLEPEHLADLYGSRVLVTVTDGHYTLYVPDHPPRGSGRTVYGVVLGAVASIGSLIGFVLAPSSALFLIFVLTTLLVLPWLTYRDAWHLRTHSDWDGGPLFWATVAMLPGVNVLSTALYLSQRSSATRLH